MEKRLPLNANNWLTALSLFLEENEGFEGTTLVLDQKHSYNDILQFDLTNYNSELESKFISKLERRFGGLVTAQFNPDGHSSRNHVVTFVVRPPSPIISQMLQNIYAAQKTIIDAKPWPAWLLTILMFIALGAVGHASYLLHEHTTSKTNPFAILIHNVTFHLAKLYLFSGL